MTNQQIGVCSWSLRPRNPQELIDALRRTELGAVQLALSPLVNDPSTWSGAIDALRASEITVLSGMMAMRGEDYSTLDSIRRTGGVRPAATWTDNLNHAIAVASIAGDTGVSLVTFHAGFLPHDPTHHERTVMLDRLAAIADVFAERGVEVALETGQESAVTLLAVLDDLDRANVGVNFDPANMILYGQGDPIEALRMLSPHVRQVHVKDAIPADMAGTWGRETVAGQGAVNWPGFFEAVTRIQPAVNFVIEREAGRQGLSDIIAARDLIRSHLRSLQDMPRRPGS